MDEADGKRGIEREREGGQQEESAERGRVQGAPLGQLQKLPRLNVPSLSIRGVVIKRVSSLKLKELH